MKNKILFITATHGDEGFSIKVLDELEKKCPRNECGFERIIGNPKAFKRNIRYTEVDLNRSAPGKMGSRIYEEKRAAQIMKIANKFKFVIDLHGANSKCGIVIIICNPILSNFVLAGMFPIKKIIIWRTKEDFKKGPLTQFCKSVGLEIECGRKTDSRIKNKLKKVLIKFLKIYQKITIKEIMKNLREKEFYVIYDKQVEKDNKLQDFKKVKNKNEVFYPFMSNVYPNIACYKMKKIKLENLFLTQSKI